MTASSRYPIEVPFTETVSDAAIRMSIGHMKKTTPISFIGILLGLGIGITAIATFSGLLILAALAGGLLLIMPDGDVATAQTAATALLVAAVAGTLTFGLYRSRPASQRPRPSLWVILPATCLVSLIWAIICTIYDATH
jgi:hypothetical protein